MGNPCEKRRSLRVAHVGGLESESASGVQEAFAGLVKHLPAHGVRVEMWSFSPGFKEPRDRQVGEVHVLELPSRPRPWNALGLPVVSRREIRAHSRDVDIVHFHSVFIPENVFAARLLSVPYLITPHGGYNERVLRRRNRFLKSVWSLLFERSYARGAVALHAVSAAEAVDLAHLVGSGRVFEVPNAVDETCLRRDVKTPAGNDLLFLGRLDVAHKGLDLLLRGFASSTEETSMRSRLLLAGPDFRGGQATLTTLARGLAVEDRVRFMGPVFGDDKWALMDACYGFVHPSRWEGLPFSVLEALALGRPVIVTPETNISALVKRYRAGFVVDGTPESIRDGIVALLRASPSEYRAMQRGARSLIEENLVWERTADSMAFHYRSLTRSRDDSPGQS